jgi:hypothetical protein
MFARDRSFCVLRSAFMVADQLSVSPFDFACAADKIANEDVFVTRGIGVLYSR